MVESPPGQHRFDLAHGAMDASARDVRARFYSGLKIEDFSESTSEFSRAFSTQRWPASVTQIFMAGGRVMMECTIPRRAGGRRHFATSIIKMRNVSRMASAFTLRRITLVASRLSRCAHCLGTNSKSFMRISSRVRRVVGCNLKR